MSYFHEIRRLFLSFLVTMVMLPKFYFIHSLSSGQASAISRGNEDSCNYTKKFWKPRICAKNKGRDEAGHSATNAMYRLVRLDGVKVGHVRELNLSEDKTYRVVTRSLRPLLFQIPQFLSRKECDEVIQITQRQHLKDSETVYGKGEGIPMEEFEKSLKGRNMSYEKAALCRRMFRSANLDKDKDRKISLQEFITMIDREKRVHPTNEDARPIFRLFDVDLDGFIVPEECVNLTNAVYSEFLYHLEELKLNPRYYLRFSETASLPRNEPLVKTLQERIAKLTGLSRRLIEKSEPIQVSLL